MCYAVSDEKRYFCKKQTSMDINRPINRRNALKVLGLGMLATCVPTPPEPEEPNRNARYRNPNVSIADLIKANSQI